MGGLLANSALHFNAGCMALGQTVSLPKKTSIQKQVALKKRAGLAAVAVAVFERALAILPARGNKSLCILTLARVVMATAFDN